MNPKTKSSGVLRDRSAEDKLRAIERYARVTGTTLIGMTSVLVAVALSIGQVLKLSAGSSTQIWMIVSGTAAVFVAAGITMFTYLRGPARTKETSSQSSGSDFGNRETIVNSRIDARYDAIESTFERLESQLERLSLQAEVISSVSIENGLTSGGVETSVRNRQIDQAALERLISTKLEIERSITIEQIRSGISSEMESSSRRVSDLIAGALMQEFPKILASSYGENALIDARATRLRQLAKEAKDRLSQEVKDLGRRGNVNLVIGSLTTIAAAALLAYVVFSTDLNAAGTAANLTPKVLLRVSIVGVIEVFSFFFLRLYKMSLLEIKYFQNEITNIDFKLGALESAMVLGNEQAIVQVLSEMSRTERNFVLKKGETAVELERAKAESDTFKDAIELLSKFAPRSDHGGSKEERDRK